MDVLYTVYLCPLAKSIWTPHEHGWIYFSLFYLTIHYLQKQFQQWTKYSFVFEASYFLCTPTPQLKTHNVVQNENLYTRIHCFFHLLNNKKMETVSSSKSNIAL